MSTIRSEFTGIHAPGAAAPRVGAPAGPPIIAVDVPVIYEDEGQDEMGESVPHTTADTILSFGITLHLQDRPEYRVYSNLNMYYHPIDRWAYVSPDVMAVIPTAPLPDKLRSYRIGVHGPRPDSVIEILSRRSAQQQDLTNKPDVYAFAGVQEYILFDPTGEFLERRLVLRRLQDDGSWLEEQDADGGVTSRLGFRIVIDEDDLPRVINAATGQPYPRPIEAADELRAARAAAVEAMATANQAQATAEAEAEARRQAERAVEQLRAELERLRGKPNGGGVVGK